MKAKIRGEQKMKLVEPKPMFRPGEMGVVLEYSVHTPDGKVTEHKRMKSKSFVRQYLELLYVQMAQIPYNYPINIKGTDGISRTVAESVYTFHSLAGEGVHTNGVVVGDGVGAVTVDDYALGNKIAHGNTTGLLWYGAQTFGSPGAGASVSQFRLTRDFTNSTATGSPPGASITVNEIGVYCYGTASGTTSYQFMIIRDIVSPGIVIPVGQILTVNYEEQVTL